MSHETLITALDIGSTTIRAASAIAKKDAPLRVVGIGESPSRGVRRGQIVDIGEVTQALGDALSEAERTAGAHITTAAVTIGGAHVERIESHGSVAVSRADGIVSHEDVNRVVETAKTISLPANKEVVAVLPRSFSIDDEKHLVEPVGMKGVRLEVDTVLVVASQPVLRTFSKTLESVKRSADQWVYAPFALARALLSKDQREAGALLVDIGGASTTLMVFREGELERVASIPMGAENVTHDIAIGLRIALDSAEKVKRDYGHCFTPDVSRREQVVLAEFGAENIHISRYSLAQIGEQRMCEIFDAVQKEVRPYLKDRKLPAGITLTGGGARLPGVVELAKRECKLPARIGRVQEIESEQSEIFDPSYALAAGALLQVYDTTAEQDASFSSSLGVSRFAQQAKEWLRELMP